MLHALQLLGNSGKFLAESRIDQQINLVLLLDDVAKAGLDLTQGLFNALGVDCQLDYCFAKRFSGTGPFVFSHGSPQDDTVRRRIVR